jgi:hypothetical protein
MRGSGWVVRDWISADYGRSIDLSKSTSGSFCVRLCELVDISHARSPQMLSQQLGLRHARRGLVGDSEYDD